MRLLSRVIDHTEQRTRCEVDPAASALFGRADGSVPSWVALEWMAQCAAAHGALLANASGHPSPPGLLLRARDVRLAEASFAPGDALVVEARLSGASGALVRFDCAVRRAGRAEQPRARGQLSVRVSTGLDPRAGGKP
jgi:predicted hotdog family 3-hydroxylacyl-ACP dehydratase